MGRVSRKHSTGTAELSRRLRLHAAAAAASFGCAFALLAPAPAVAQNSSTQGQTANDPNSKASETRDDQIDLPLLSKGGPILPTLPTFTIADGTFKLGGLARFRFDSRFNEVNALGNPRTTNHFSFDTVGPKASYDSSTFFASMQYRFYGGSFLYSGNAGYKDYVGEVSFPMWAYIGYKLTPHDTITGGLNQVPFALVPYFGSSFLESLAYAMGIEEVYAAGFKYSHDDDRYDFQLGFYPRANPNAFGISNDSSRYSTAIVAADSATPNGSNNREENMLIARGEYFFVKNSTVTIAAGADFWRSGVRNLNTNEVGTKQNEGVHINAIFGQWNFRGVYVRQDINTKNPASVGNDFLTIGSFDASYNMATHGNNLSTELNYHFKQPIAGFDVMPYLDYDAYYKDDPNFKNTERYILGSAFTLKRDPRLLIYVEGVFGRNDPFVGAGQFESGLAQGGDNKWKREIIVDIGFYF